MKTVIFAVLVLFASGCGMGYSKTQVPSNLVKGTPIKNRSVVYAIDVTEEGVFTAGADLEVGLIMPVPAIWKNQEQIIVIDESGAFVDLQVVEGAPSQTRSGVLKFTPTLGLIFESPFHWHFLLA